LFTPSSSTRSENYETYRNQIAISESQLDFSDTKSDPTVVVIGMLKNTSLVSWKEIQFHITSNVVTPGFQVGRPCTLLVIGQLYIRLIASLLARDEADTLVW